MFPGKNVAAILVALAAGLFAIPSLSSEADTSLDQLNAADKAVFEKLEDRTRRLTGDEEEIATLKVEIERFASTHPDFVPIMVEAHAVEWIRLSGGLGLINGSRSSLPGFLEYQAMAPDYPKSYIQAARAYIYTGDFEGALPSLRKATELAPNDPWVDLTWALLHDRRIEREAAQKAARKAIPKATGDDIAMAVAILTVAKHFGIGSPEAALGLADAVCQVRCDPAYLTAVIATIMDGYNNEIGLLDVAAELSNRAAEQEAPKPELLLQWARIALYTGNRHIAHSAPKFDPVFMRPAEEVLVAIKDEPSVAEDVWTYRFDIALSRGSAEEAERLLREGEARGFSPKTVGLKRAILRYREGNVIEMGKIYMDLGLRDDALMAEAQARSGDAESARRYYQRQVEDSPTNAFLLADYAGFLLWFVSDAEEAIRYGTQAYELFPYPYAQNILAAAYLSLTGEQLSRGQLATAAETYASAADLGFDENYVVTLCYETCDEIRAAMTAFRREDGR